MSSFPTKRRSRIHPQSANHRRRAQELEFIASSQTPWVTLHSDSKNSWLVPENADEYDELASVAGMFDAWTLGLGSNRDSVVFDWDKQKLGERMETFIDDYNLPAHAHRVDPERPGRRTSNGANP